MRTSAKAAVAGFPDFFIYKICEGYLYGRELELQFVEGNGNCLPNSILKQVNFTMDPGSDHLYTQTYLRHQVIMHLIANWEVLGQEIKENIKISYGRPDSIVGGLQIKSVLWADSLHSTMYRYEGSFHLADIILMYNSNPVKGHYSPVGHCGKGLVFESNSKRRLRRAPG